MKICLISDHWIFDGRGVGGRGRMRRGVEGNGGVLVNFSVKNMLLAFVAVQEFVFSTTFLLGFVLMCTFF